MTRVYFGWTLVCLVCTLGGCALQSPNPISGQSAALIDNTCFASPEGTGDVCSESSPCALDECVTQLETTSHATLNLLPGRYYLHDSTSPGTGLALRDFANGLVVQRTPGHAGRAIFDGRVRDVRWESEDAAQQLYRSTEPFDHEIVGFFQDDSGRWRNLPTYQRYVDLVSDIQTVTAGARYAGPGVFWDYISDGTNPIHPGLAGSCDPTERRIVDAGIQCTRRYFLRLEPPDPASIHGRDFTGLLSCAPNCDPTDTPGAASAAPVVLTYAGRPGSSCGYPSNTVAGVVVSDSSDVVVRDVEFQFFETALQTANVDGALLTNLEFIVARTAIRGGPVRDLVVDAVRVNNGFPEWIAWSDIKGGFGPGGNYNRPFSEQSAARLERHCKPDAKTSSVGFSGSSSAWSENIEVRNSYILHTLDAIAGPSYARNVDIHHNYFSPVDDSAQLATHVYDFTFHHNLVAGPGPSHGSWSADDIDPGTKYVFQNIITNEVHLWGRLDPEERLKPTYRGWRSSNGIGSHDSPGDADDGDPWRIYHNTMMVEGPPLGIELWQEVAERDPSTAHTVYNNIFVQYDAAEALLRDMDSTLGDNAQSYDGDLYFRSASTTPLFRDVVDRSGVRQHYDDLASFQAGAGWESSGVFADPEFHNADRSVEVFARDYRPRAPAAVSGAVSLVGRGWPGPFDAVHHMYRGACDPALPDCDYVGPPRPDGGMPGSDGGIVGSDAGSDAGVPPAGDGAMLRDARATVDAGGDASVEGSNGCNGCTAGTDSRSLNASLVLILVVLIGTRRRS